jgi:predicted DNA-binding protein
MKRKRRYYPSQERYQADNPTVSFRLPKEDKDRLEEIAKMEGTTIGQYVRDFLKGIVEEKKGYYEGYNEGLKKGRESWKIQWDCSVCGNVHVIQPNSWVHELIASSLHKQRVCILSGRKQWL